MDPLERAKVVKALRDHEMRVREVQKSMKAGGVRRELFDQSEGHGGCSARAGEEEDCKEDDSEEVEEDVSGVLLVEDAVDVGS